MILFNAPVATFIHIPKVAGTSMMTWASSVPNKNLTKHIKFNQIKMPVAQLGQVFAFVRNPWDRMVSLHSYLVARCREKSNDKRRHQRWTHNDDRFLSLYADNFSNWIRDTHSPNVHKPVDVIDPCWHSWDSQHSWIQGCSTALVFKLEELDKINNFLKNFFDHDSCLPVKNTSQHSRYRDYYSTATRKMVAEMFDTDIQLYRYNF
jgi:chondroitin 4-sulfotransferase 11